MEALLQKLWNQFCITIQKIDKLTDDQNIDEEPYCSLTEIVGDTEEMKELRQRLYDVGAQNVSGFTYPKHNEN